MIKIFHFFLIILLTVITQVGGIIYFITLLIVKKSNKKHILKRTLTFAILYSLTSFLLVPLTAPLFGKERIHQSDYLQAHTFFTRLCNRDYVTPKMNATLKKIAKNLNKEYPKIQLIYLDASFPFFNGFPLLPHLSHNDGKKIDLSFIYETSNGKVSNLKMSRSGYGVYTTPKENEFDQTKYCQSEGYWQYDFTKHLTFGSINKRLRFSNSANLKLIHFITEQEEVEKVFVEPHLKNRLQVSSPKIRFHGCRAVRHDDHIHFQVY